MSAISELASLILAISLAAERLVALLKTFVPWLLPPDGPPTKATSFRAGLVDKETWRRVTLWLIAFLTCWVTAAFLAEPEDSLLKYLVGTIDYGPARTLPVLLVAFLASGGSAFWNQLLGYAKAVKDARNEEALRTRALRLRGV